MNRKKNSLLGILHVLESLPRICSVPHFNPWSAHLQVDDLLLYFFPSFATETMDKWTVKCLPCKGNHAARRLLHSVPFQATSKFLSMKMSGHQSSHYSKWAIKKSHPKHSTQGKKENQANKSCPLYSPHLNDLLSFFEGKPVLWKTNRCYLSPYFLISGDHPPFRNWSVELGIMNSHLHSPSLIILLVPFFSDCLRRQDTPRGCQCPIKQGVQ